jgi:hypothetical protein
MLEIIASAIWLCFGTYFVWYCALAKKYAPITIDDARLLWKIHKQKVHCDSTKWREIRKGKKTIGFKCACGYMHVQNRPLVGSTPSQKVRQEPLFNELHIAYEKR